MCLAVKLKANHPTEGSRAELSACGFSELPPLRIKVVAGPPTAALEMPPLPLPAHDEDSSDSDGGGSAVAWQLCYSAANGAWVWQQVAAAAAAATDGAAQSDEEEGAVSCCGLFKSQKPMRAPEPAPAIAPERPGQPRLALSTGRAGVTLSCPSLSAPPYTDGAAWLLLEGPLQQHELRLGDVLKLGSVLMQVAALDSNAEGGATDAAGGGGSSSSSSSSSVGGGGGGKPKRGPLSFASDEGPISDDGGYLPVRGTFEPLQRLRRAPSRHGLQATRLVVKMLTGADAGKSLELDFDEEEDGADGSVAKNVLTMGSGGGAAFCVAAADGSVHPMHATLEKAGRGYWLRAAAGARCGVLVQRGALSGAVYLDQKLELSGSGIPAGRSIVLQLLLAASASSAAGKAGRVWSHLGASVWNPCKERHRWTVLPKLKVQRRAPIRRRWPPIAADGRS